MFTRQELLERLEHEAGRPHPPLQARIYGPHDFAMRADEESVLIVRAPRPLFSDGLGFWMAAIASEEWESREQYEKYFRPYLAGALCRPLSKAKFEAMAQNIVSPLKAQLRPSWNTKAYQSGMTMFEKWNDMGVLAEFESEWLWLQWETSA